jgi:hypothetical protein
MNSPRYSLHEWVSGMDDVQKKLPIPLEVQP